jgi:hypothetical protein
MVDFATLSQYSRIELPATTSISILERRNKKNTTLYGSSNIHRYYSKRNSMNALESNPQENVIYLFRSWYSIDIFVLLGTVS